MNYVFVRLTIIGVILWLDQGLGIGQTNVPTPVASTPSPAVGAGVSLPLSKWSLVGAKDATFGPKEEEGKVTFGGVDFGAKGKNMAAYFPKTELGVGQTLRFKGVVRFAGVAGTGHFRFGVFQKKSTDHPRGWLGYCAYAGLDKAFPKGNLLVRLAGNDGAFDGMKGSKGEETAKSLGESILAIKTIKDGPYQLSFSVKRAATSMEVSASMDGLGDMPVPMVDYKVTDEAPATTTFDALGFSSHQVLSADSIEFSEMSVNLEGP